MFFDVIIIVFIILIIKSNPYKLKSLTMECFCQYASKDVMWKSNHLLPYFTVFYHTMIAVFTVKFQLSPLIFFNAWLGLQHIVLGGSRIQSLGRASLSKKWLIILLFCPNPRVLRAEVNILLFRVHFQKLISTS